MSVSLSGHDVAFTIAYILCLNSSTVSSTFKNNRWSEIVTLENSIATSGHKAHALWVKDQQSLTPTSHRAFFRERLNPRAVESYLYGVPGPKACEKNARFRRFAFTYKDKELSRGHSGAWAGNTGLPFTPMAIETLSINGLNYYAVKFGKDLVRFVTHLDFGDEHLEEFGKRLGSI